jgi:hypothetical protein
MTACGACGWSRHAGELCNDAAAGLSRLPLLGFAGIQLDALERSGALALAGIAHAVRCIVRWGQDQPESEPPSGCWIAPTDQIDCGSLQYRPTKPAVAVARPLWGPLSAC